MTWTFLIMPLAHWHGSGTFPGEAHFSERGLHYENGGLEHSKSTSESSLSGSENSFCHFCDFLFSSHYILKAGISLQRTTETIHTQIGTSPGIFDAAFSSLFNKGSPF